jgi:hypothetical protein
LRIFESELELIAPILAELQNTVILEESIYKEGNLLGLTEPTSNKGRYPAKMKEAHQLLNDHQMP